MNSFDLIVLGGGSGGLAAAKRAAKYGARVGLVEGDRVGGTCVIRGCVPKKLLVYGASYSQYFKIASDFGVEWKEARIDAQVLLKNVRNEVNRLNQLHIDLLSRAGVDLIRGWGRFTSPNTILVERKEGNVKKQIEIHGERILVAVGGHARRPDIPGAELGWISDDVFLQEQFPKKVVVVGGGYIACELACIFNGLGINVIQLVRGNSLLRGFDSELSASLYESMIRDGIEIHLCCQISSLEGEIGHLKAATNCDQIINCGAVLFATGRSPLLNGLNLESVGVKCSGDKVLVDINQSTNIKHIYAIGDVTDNINLTPVAIAEGRAFADSIYGNKPSHVDHSLVASAVFSQPEIATVGLTEEQAVKTYGEKNVCIYRARFRPMSKSLSKTDQHCLLKLIVEGVNQRIIGCHMLGENAAEIIQMASIAIGMGATKSDFDNTMALHPTISEEFVTMI